MKGCKPVLVLATVAWSSAVGAGMARMLEYQHARGPASPAPTQWPETSQISRSADLPTLVLFLHPHCPCSRATLDELTRLITHCQGKLTCHALFLKPKGMPDGWEQTDQWHAAAAIPGVRVAQDDQGAEARRFHAETSGQAMLYSTQGELLFAGGITPSRGHSGDNAGRSAILSLLREEVPVVDEAPVFGCPLFRPVEATPGIGEGRSGEGESGCRACSANGNGQPRER
jgi:hypothetical protein